MMMTRIRLGLTINLSHPDPHRPLYRGKTLQYVEQNLLLSLHQAGASVTIVPCVSNMDIDLLDEVDGLVLSGGADVSPAGYGEQAMDPRWEGDPVRDAYELRLIRHAFNQRKPVLGICRGAQILNVACGGSLFQDIATQRPEAQLHRDWERYDTLSHEVHLAPGSWTSTCHDGLARVHVNSVHHQSVRRLGEGLIATAWAPDEIIEAIECTTDERWAVGIQWHPEWLEGATIAHPAAATATRVFSNFVDVCRTRRA